MAHKAAFVGSIQHTEATIQRLFKTEWQTYHRLRILAQLTIGFIMVAMALTVSMNRIAQALLLLAGCLLMVGKDFPAAARAYRTLDERKGQLPKNVHSFFPDFVELSGEGTMRLKYNQFQRLIEDNEYLYLFLGSKSVCMIDKASVKGGNAEALKAFVAERTGQAWRRNRSLLSMNLAELRQIIRDHRSL